VAERVPLAQRLAPELAAPLPLAAIALLVANDHVLKARFPGAVTGKLSDVAGCFVLPLLVSAIAGLATRWTLRARLALGAALTGALMLAMKLSPAGADLVASALAAAWRPLGVRSGPIAADPTDLLAVPFALAAFWYGARRARGSEG
jgi:hypothetical protein